VGESIPYPAETFDLIFADNVLEHLTDPEAVLREVVRVLKPGGIFLAKTPNKYHYMPLVARLTPHGFHQFINRLRGRASVDTFPTRYRINTPGAIRYYAARSGLRVRGIRLIEGRPEYLRLSSFTYLLGWLYERLVNALPGLERFRILLIAVLEKPA
jgi:SAM-dependent methyltransferase